MKCVMSLFIVLGLYLTNSTLIQYKSGTIIKQLKVINTGSNTMNLVLHIPRELNQTNFIYFRPCDYVNYIQADLMHAGIASNVSKILTQFTQTCKIFTRLRRIHSQLRLTYEEKIDESLGAINLLTHENKQKRSIFSAIRHVFNIADYNKQKRLEEIVNNLDQDRITVTGQLNDMTFVITHQEEKIKQLQKSALHITDLVKKINVNSNELVDILTAQDIVTHYRDRMFFDLFSAGILANELAQEYTSVMKERLTAFALLQRKYLPPSLVSPTDLQLILNKLVTQVAEKHQFLRLYHENIFTYYGMQNINFYLQNNSYYVQIPVLFKMYEQEFKLFNLQSIHLPMPRQPGKLMRAIHSDYIAINVDTGTYMILQENWRRTLDCHGHHEVYCKHVMTQRYMLEEPNCEVAIMKNKTNDILKQCEFAIVDKKDVLPTVHNIQDNRVLVENPEELKIYQRCTDNSMKKFVTQAVLAEIIIPCFCSLVSETFTTTLITTDDCVNTPEVKLYNPMENIIFLQLLLNTTRMETNKTYNVIPKLQMPELISNFMMEEDKHLLNLKEVIRAHKTAYYSTARNTLIRHETMSQSFSIFKYCAMIAPILGIIIIIVIICFCVRMKGLGQMVSLISMPKASIALPIEKSNEDWKEEFDMFASLCTLLLLLLWLVYLILQYYKFFDRVQKTISLPFKECVSATSPPSYKIVLYLKNFNTYCYLYIAEVMKYPEKILTPTRETELYLAFHSSWCNSYVTLNNNDITLIFKEDSFILPNAIHVPAILRHTVRTILSTDNHVELMIGSGSHFRVLNISSMENALAPPVEDD